MTGLTERLSALLAGVDGVERGISAISPSSSATAACCLPLDATGASAMGKSCGSLDVEEPSYGSRRKR